MCAHFFTLERICLTIVVAILFASSAFAFPKGKADNQLMRLMAFKEMREAVILEEKGDARMVKEVDLVADHVEQFLKQQRRAVRDVSIIDQKELSRFARQISLSPDPYSPTSPDSKDVKLPKAPPRLKVTMMPSLDVAGTQAFRNKPPADWIGEKASIQIFHNGYDTVMIWAAGMSGHPVFDKKRQRFKIVTIRSQP